MAGLTDKQREFCRLLVEDRLSKPDAYRKAFKRKDLSNPAASKAASRLSKDDEICRYIDELNAELDKKAIMSKQERMEWLSRVVRTPINSADGESDLCQEYTETQGDTFSSTKYKMPSKIQAIQELNRMDGAYEPEKVETTVSVVGSVLAGILSSPIIKKNHERV